MNYDGFVQQISILAQQAISPGYSLADVPDFENTIPTIIAYSEGRIYRDCVFLAQRVQDATQKFSANSRNLSLAPIDPPFMVVEGLAMITPINTIPSAGTRWNFDMASIDLIDLMWPQESVTSSPSAVDYRYCAMKDNATMVVAPTPDSTYTAEITGLIQPSPLSADNPTTYLLTVYPDLFVVAAMIFVSGYLRDYGAQSEDPKTGLSWESQYGNLVKGAVLEEQRRRTQGVGWSPNQASPIATPPRN